MENSFRFRDQSDEMIVRYRSIAIFDTENKNFLLTLINVWLQLFKIKKERLNIYNSLFKRILSLSFHKKGE